MEQPQDMPSLDDMKKLPPKEAIRLLSVFISLHPADDEAFTIRGMKYWSLNMRKEAIGDYLKAIEINPSSRARMALQFANSILDYYNKDLLNP